jgi:hypothetical protein
LNGPREFWFVLTPPVLGRAFASAVRAGILPSSGSVISHGRLLRRSNVSKIRCGGGEILFRQASLSTCALKRRSRSATISAIFSGVTVASVRPSNSAGRYIGVPVSSSLE